MEDTKAPYKTDHDLLIELNVRFQDLNETIKRMDGTISRDIGGLQQGKVDKEVFATHCVNDTKEFDAVKKEQKTMWEKYDKHDNNINLLNRYLWIGMGALAVFQFIAPFLISKYFK